MVQLHVKRGDESQFLLNTSVDVPVEDLIQQVAAVYNGRLKVERICGEMRELADHGVALPPNMQGLAQEQVLELKLRDDWQDQCVPSGGAELHEDEVGRRNGRGESRAVWWLCLSELLRQRPGVSAPNAQMKQVIRRTVEEAKALVSKRQVEAGVSVTMETVREALDLLRGATMIVYPMGLPPHDPIRMELEERQDLSGTQASLQVITQDQCQLWWAAKELQGGRRLHHYVGKNEKTKLVVKIQKKGQGAPAREPLVTEEQQKQMMLQYHRRQEELKRLEAEAEDHDHSYLDSRWSDRQALKRQFQGLADIKWGPR